ncbi:barstar family protein [Microbispora sp. CA-135349]|uniref:barstar family protein n=1 Tax=Microbispora sp. CA-135349 TaxID=3239953 RepID=UPI003D90D9AD
MASAARPLPPWLTVTADPAPAVADGRACRTRDAFFDEVTRVLRLPAYFGRNWDALTDSLRDIGPVHLVVNHAEQLLDAEPPGQFATLLAVLAGAAEAGLTLALHTDPAHEPLLHRRLIDALP